MSLAVTSPNTAASEGNGMREEACEEVGIMGGQTAGEISTTRGRD